MIDWSRVKELKDEVGEEDFDEVLELFFSEVFDCLERLDPNAGVAQLEEDMHFLKGSALNLGFTDFARLCQKGESGAASGDTTAVDVNEVKSLFDMSKQALEAHASDQAA